MEQISAEDLRKKLLDEVENSYATLKKSFELFNKKWAQSQKSGPLDRKEMDELITEALYEGIDKANETKK